MGEYAGQDVTGVEVDESRICSEEEGVAELKEDREECLVYWEALFRNKQAKMMEMGERKEQRGKPDRKTETLQKIDQNHSVHDLFDKRGKQQFLGPVSVRIDKRLAQGNGNQFSDVQRKRGQCPCEDVL